MTGKELARKEKIEKIVTLMNERQINEMTVEMLIVAAEYKKFSQCLLSDRARELLPEGDKLNSVLAKINQWEDESHKVGHWQGSLDPVDS